MKLLINYLLLFLLLGDFNGHNFIWGSDDVNDKGRIIENFINKNNLSLYI